MRKWRMSGGDIMRMKKPTASSGWLGGAILDG